MALSLKLSPRATLKFKTQTKIPAQLLGGEGITVTFVNGVYTVSWSGGGLFTSSLGLTLAQNANTAIDVTNTNAGTLAGSSVRFSTDQGVAGGVGATSSGYTGILLLQNRVYLDAAPGTAGIALNAEGPADTIDFGIGNALFARMNASGGLNITPTALSYNRALSIVQSGPTSSTPGPHPYSIVTVNHQSAVTGTGDDATGNNNAVAVASRVNMLTELGISGA